MKYLKICSFAVALLLLASPATAAVTCTLGTSLDQIRMESGMEPLDDLTVTCTWSVSATDTAAVTVVDPTAGVPGPPAVAGAAASGAKFNLDLDLNGMLNEDADAPTLMLLDLNAASTVPLATNNTAAAGVKNTTVDDMGYRSVEGEVSGRSVLWPDVVYPATWDETGAGSGTFMISGITVDASSVNNDRLKATIVVSGGTVDTDDDADIARVQQALDLEFSEDNKAQKFNACEPGDKEISINVMEGFRKAWKSGSMANEIMLMTSSGKISAKDTGILDVLAGQGGADEIIIDVSDAMDSKDDSTNLAIKFEPAMGGEGDITLSAMFLPMRASDESFIKSAELVVGSFDVCKGDKLFFPFITTRTGWDAGIAVINDSKLDGSCYLNWGNLEFADADDMAAYVENLPTIEVDAKGHDVILASDKFGADKSGSLGVQCTFSAAHGYIFLYDGANDTGQGYVVEGK